MSDLLRAVSGYRHIAGLNAPSMHAADLRWSRMEGAGASSLIEPEDIVDISSVKAAGISASSAPLAAGIPSSSGNKDAFISMVTEQMRQLRHKVIPGEQESSKSLFKQNTLADVTTALSQAQMAVDTAVTIRDRVVAAYQELIKMPI
jgi:flagellar hook-basal body complex protein FliE